MSIQIDGEYVDLKRFPDGTASMHYAPSHDGVNIVWKYESDAELFAVVCLARHIQESYGYAVRLIMPYIPNARMDRVSASGEDVFTLKYFAEIINSVGFETVSVLDPHSSVSMALFDRVRTYRPAGELIHKAIQDAPFTPRVAFYPDEGSMKRYHNAISLPYLFGVKNRDWATGKIKSFDAVGDTSLVNGQSVIIVDDIISKGGTCYHSAIKLRELGASHVYVYATHCENTIYDGKLLDGDLIDMVYTTDSIAPNCSEKVTVWSFENA